MSTNLWDEHQTDSDSTADATATASTTADGSEQSPLAAAIEASTWSRADIELALNVAQVVLLVVWVVHAYNDD